MRWASPIAIAFAAALAGCDAGLTVNPPQPGVEGEAIDWSIDPCNDFYRFACGNWTRWHKVGSDGAYTSRRAQVQAAQTSALIQIAEDDARGPAAADDPWGAKIGDYYGGCRTAAVATAVAAPALNAQLGLIDQLGTATLAQTLAALHADGVWPLFVLWWEPDPADPTRPIATVYQSGFGLDRAYFQDPTLSGFVDAYRRHIDDMVEAVRSSTGLFFEVDGDAVLRIETQLAAASLGADDYRDPNAVYHPLPLETLQAAVPHVDWAAYLRAGSVTLPSDTVDVQAPDYFTALDQLVASTPTQDLQSYLRWRALEAAGSALGSQVDVVELQFHTELFYGASALAPDWWRCYQATQSDLGFALSRPFVARDFGDGQRREASALIEAVRAAMDGDIASRAWLDEPTRQQAQGKLAAVVAKIGYPDAWPSYDDVRTSRSDYLQSRVWRRNAAWRQMVASLAVPVDRAAWHIAPSITNAIYDPTANDITFPAAILQSPFFVLGRAPAANYGAIGSIMGHELSHGFDDEGRRYDGLGALRDWWSPAVADEFERRATCLVDQFAAYDAVGDLHVDGNLTLGENIADLGGLKLAYAAFRADAGGQGQGSPGLFSPDQQFFLAFAQNWCETDRASYLASAARADPHAPVRYRVNGTVTNVPEFAAAFHCPAGAPLAPRDRCEIW